MSIDPLRGIRWALKLAKLTGRSVNIGLNNNGKPKKIEGKVLSVCLNTFRIRLDSGGAKTYAVANTEYVEYS